MYGNCAWAHISRVPAHAKDDPLSCTGGVNHSYAGAEGGAVIRQAMIHSFLKTPESVSDEQLLDFDDADMYVTLPHRPHLLFYQEGIMTIINALSTHTRYKSTLLMTRLGLRMTLSRMHVCVCVCVRWRDWSAEFRALEVGLTGGSVVPWGASGAHRPRL